MIIFLFCRLDSEGKQKNLPFSAKRKGGRQNNGQKFTFILGKKVEDKVGILGCLQYVHCISIFL